MDQDARYAKENQPRMNTPRNEPSGPVAGCGVADEPATTRNRLSLADEATGPNPHYIGGGLGRAMSTIEHRCVMAIAEGQRAEARARAARRAFDILQKNPELGEFYDLIGQF